MKTLSFLLATFLASSLSSLAHADCQPGIIDGYIDARVVKKITGYIPKIGGINGRVGTSASMADASHYSWEKFMAGQGKIVMIAIPQVHPSIKNQDRYFKSVFRVPSIERQVGKCVLFFAGDRYARDSMKDRPWWKMDMVHEPPYKNAFKFNQMKNTPVYIISGPQMVRGKRIILREAGAISKIYAQASTKPSKSI